MRLTKKKIEQVISGILGEEGFPLLKQLLGKENVSEFDLAKKINKDIKIVRKMLYLLYNHNLISFNRKKDKQKGWYIYYWTLIPNNIKFSYHKSKINLLNRLKNRLQEENKEIFFICDSQCIRLNFDKSMDYEFHCPDCGELLTQDDNKKKIQEIEKKIKEIEKELAKENESITKDIKKSSKSKVKKVTKKNKTTSKKKRSTVKEKK